MAKQIYVGKIHTLDAVQDVLSAARQDWIKNDRVSRAIKRAMKEIVHARGIAEGEINRSLEIQVKIR